MDHTHIIHAGDLARYADTRESEAVIPELVYHLVRQSVPDATVLRIPYGDAVNQPGLDGLVESESGFFEYVPKGRSCWEIGTGANPQKKATDEFRKRTTSLSATQLADSSFVFVTPRSAGSSDWGEPEQTAWIKRRSNRGWRQISIIDGVKLADWLREFPAIGRWMAKKVGIAASLGGISTPFEHWDLILSQGEKSDPPLPPTLFTSSRANACAALEAVFKGDSQRLCLFSESEHDVDDFIAAYLATLEEVKAIEFSNRCLLISEENAWRSVVETRCTHVLVANPRLGLDSERQDLQTFATRRGHSVIIPLCGAWSAGASPEIIKMRSPSQSQIESILTESGFPEVRARELAAIGGGRISALRRHLLGLGALPPYATWDNARELAQAGLAGQWDGTNQADVAAMAGLLGKDYGEWIEKLRANALRSDSPLIQSDERWRFVARGEAWNALGNRITDDDLARLQETAVTVLGERDPKFDLPKEERFAASIRGKELEYSSLLRSGLAETLALVGSRPKALSSCSLGNAETTAILVVRRLLNGASWDRWASLDLHLPLLAEAAPDEFLDAVESVLVDLDAAPFHEIFAQEGSGGLGGWNYMSGLLWALETLAWNADNLSRVAVILADIASIDAGGSWSNRPANSLADILLPWHVQTTAPFDKRKAAVETVLREQPEVGWELLLALLPHSHGSTSGCHRPTWREYIPRDWKDGVLVSEYWEQITAFTELAVRLAKGDAEKLDELINRLSDLPLPAQEGLLGHLASEEIVTLSEAERLPLWEKLEGLARQHRRFADAAWALPEEVVKSIERTANELAPQTPELKYRYLFSDRDFELFDKDDDYDEQERRLNEARQSAVRTILEVGGLASALTFAQSVSAPHEVGRALGVIASQELEDELLPSHLGREAEAVSRVVAGFVWARCRELEWTWVDAVLERSWNEVQKAAFLALLPFEEAVWHRVSKHLSEQDERLYWRDARANPYGPDRDLTIAIEKLVEYGRAADAVLCASRMAHGEGGFDETLATHALLAVLENPSTIEQLDSRTTIELIKRLQESSDADQDALFRIEWSFLPWLDRFSSGSPTTLERRLASDPTFFAEAVALVFRSKNDDDEGAKPDEQSRHLARNAYELLTAWKRCPGTQPDGSFDVDAFNVWISEARRITEETGHAEVAQIQIGHVLTSAPSDPNGLWIHEAVASVLNARDTGEMRSGFTTELFNQRGAHGFTAGRAERELARLNREKAEDLDAKGYPRFATAMREFAQEYEREAERAETRDPFRD